METFILLDIINLIRRALFKSYVFSEDKNPYYVNPPYGETEINDSDNR